jgi:Winged helix DNA-binding domain
VRMTGEQTESVVAAIGEALRESELTVDELTEAVAAQAGTWAAEPVMPAFQTLWPRWRQATDRAAFAGQLCYGPDRGRKVTYTHPRRWAGDLAPVDADVAVAWLVEQYLRGYGPATAASFAQWVGAPTAWASDQLAAHPGLLRVDLLGERAWDLHGSAVDVPDAPGSRLLSYFDAFVVGSQPRHLLFPGRARTRALSPSGQAGNYPVLLQDGLVAGVWHQRRAGRRLAVTVEPLRRLSRSRLADLEDQVRRCGEIVEADVTLTIGEVTVGPHA